MSERGVSEKGVQGFQKKWDNPALLEEKVDEYFDQTPVDEQARSGLALHLGISTRSLRNYELGTNGEEIKEVIEKAITRIERGLEVDLRKKRGNPAGTIFALKNIAGWRNNQDVEVKSAGFEIVCNVPRPEEK